jgi:DNA processing protein
MFEETTSSTHPPTPPTTEEEIHSWLRLLRSRRVGVATFYRLLAEHGSAQNALAALPKMARAAGVNGYEACPPSVINKELRTAKAANARLLCIGSDDYPAMLATLPDPPPMLWAIGDTSLLHRPTIAMVGARNASSLGIRIARKLAADLGNFDLVVVSGLARGIDTAAHIGALPGGTIAVMAGGVDVIYPPENTDLANQIATQGLRVSEQPMGLPPMARHFPTRNRIIAGLSQAVVVVEAAARSGSLITARDALDIGRDVLAIPGHPIDPRASGCNMLIRDGATLIRSAQDVADSLATQSDMTASHIATRHNAPPTTQTAPQTAAPRVAQTVGTSNRAPRSPSKQPKQTIDVKLKILEQLGPSPLAEDQLLRDLGLPTDAVGAALVDLELDGKLFREPGGLLRRSH